MHANFILLKCDTEKRTAIRVAVRYLKTVIQRQINTHTSVDLLPRGPQQMLQHQMEIRSQDLHWSPIQVAGTQCLDRCPLLWQAVEPALSCIVSRAIRIPTLPTELQILLLLFCLFLWLSLFFFSSSNIV